MNRLSHMKILRILATFGVIVIASIFAAETYTLVVQSEGDLPLPPLFGNFENSRAVLESEARKKSFRFAIIGDTKSVGTFESISEELRSQPLDFAVLLGDCTRHGTIQSHRYFRAECYDEYNQDFPVFYVVGNHDVDPKSFPVEQFEATYGPTLFSFVYQDCLFIFLRTLGEKYNHSATIAFLKDILAAHPEQYRKRFAFLHVPPSAPGLNASRTFPESEQAINLFEKIGIDYAFSGDFHGYARTKVGKTTYIITGGGGAHLKKTHGNQFHHAVILEIGKTHISEQIVPVNARRDIEDVIELYAFEAIYPFMSEHLFLTLFINLFLFGCFAILICYIVREYKRINKEFRPTTA